MRWVWGWWDEVSFGDGGIRSVLGSSEPLSSQTTDREVTGVSCLSQSHPLVLQANNAAHRNLLLHKRSHSINSSSVAVSSLSLGQWELLEQCEAVGSLYLLPFL